MDPIENGGFSNVILVFPGCNGINYNTVLCES